MQFEAGLSVPQNILRVYILPSQVVDQGLHVTSRVKE